MNRLVVIAFVLLVVIGLLFVILSLFVVMVFTLVTIMLSVVAFVTRVIGVNNFTIVLMTNRVFTMAILTIIVDLGLVRRCVVMLLAIFTVLIFSLGNCDDCA